MTTWPNLTAWPAATFTSSTLPGIGASTVVPPAAGAGAGAAGGMGAAFTTFFNATLKSGIKTILKILDFEKRITGADLIITGEGKIDKQTLMGKLSQGVLFAAQKKSIPVIALGGTIEDRKLLTDAGFLGVFCIQSSAIPLSQAMQPEITAENLKQTTSQIIRLISFNHLIP